jgi:propionyl-CoA carboxylase alpha chain
MTLIRKILIADRGVIAQRIVRTCRRLGIISVAVFSDADKEAPHARLADEAVALDPPSGPPLTKGGIQGGLEAYRDAPRLLEAARRAEVDAVHPGCGHLAADADFSAACETAGLTFIGLSSGVLRACLTAREFVRNRGIPIASDPGQPAARQIEFQIVGDKQGNVVHVFERDASLQKNGRKLLVECPAPSLNDDVRARMGKTALDLAREIGCDNAATVQFLLTPSGEFQWLGIEPFLSAEHAVTEAAAGIDLVELQLVVAEGRRLRDQVPGIRGNAIEAVLYADDAPEKGSATLPSPPCPSPGADATRLARRGEGRRLHVWDPPAENSDLRIDAGVEEGTAPLDPLLAALTCSDTVRDGAIRKLTQALKTLWAEGVTNNRALLLQALDSQEFRDGKLRLGFLDNYPLQISADETSDSVFAAACVLYLENSQHAQRVVLPGIPPNYRNNPYRDPSTTLRIGTTDLTMSWRCLGRNRYALKAGTRAIDVEVVALRPGGMSVILDGILREFQFREVGEELFVRAPIGSRVIRQLSRYPEPAKAPSAGPRTVPDRGKSAARPPSKQGV